MHIGHHGGNPSHVEVLATHAGFSLQQFSDVTLHWFIPVTLIRHIDGEFFGVFGHIHTFAGLDVLASLTVECKRHYAPAKCQYQRRLRAVHHITRSQLLGARLQEAFVGNFTNIRIGKNRENGADRHVHVDIAGAIQRVEQYQERAIRMPGYRRAVVQFFRGHACHHAGCSKRIQNHVIGDDVELFLGFALHVF